MAMVTSGLFNAFAFAGAGFLFSHIDKKGYADELRRHNRATERLAREESRWREARLTRKDRLEQTRRDLENAEKHSKTTNDALSALRLSTENAERDLQTLRKPTLKYKPSEEFQGYVNLIAGVTGLTCGYVVTKLWKKTNGVHRQ